MGTSQIRPNVIVKGNAKDGYTRMINVCAPSRASIPFREVAAEIASAAKKAGAGKSESMSSKTDQNMDDYFPPHLLIDDGEHHDRSAQKKSASIEAMFINICVARSVPRSEMLQHPGAIAAMEEEWAKLRNAEWTYDDGDVHEKRFGVWDEDEVME